MIDLLITDITYNVSNYNLYYYLQYIIKLIKKNKKICFVSTLKT